MPLYVYDSHWVSLAWAKFWNHGVSLSLNKYLITTGQRSAIRTVSHED